MGRPGLEPDDVMPSNVILTNAGSVSVPDPPQEGAVMAEAPDFPRIYYAAAEPTGRIFESAEALRAAGGTWFKTPTEAADATAQDPAPAPDHTPEDEAPAPRRHR